MKKTLSDLASMDKPFFTADDICGVLGCNAHSVRCMAKQRPELLGFPVVVVGKDKSLFGARIKIPRVPFLRFMGAITGAEGTERTKQDDFMERNEVRTSG